MMKKCKESKSDFYLALLNYRNTPVAGLDVSPSQILMSRMLRSTMPCTAEMLEPKVVENVRDKLLENKQKVEKHYNNTAHERAPFQPGDNVVIQNWPNRTWSPAKVLQSQGPRSYVLQTDTGNTVRRNSSHVRKSKHHCNVLPDHSENVTEVDPCTSAVAEPCNNEAGYVTRSGRSINKPSRLKDYVL
uniref:Uncharacterized protein LOC114336126 n=1 Tax=Diabrotica virgifera virgifera TaxID=50390 RepID=A0A6P7G5G1_DIAVI